ncbi:thioredoxin family protein [Natronospirillum operosum]|uniref:Thioredoxin family protein n=1 Tax=Natronospirillum operosum TaxID=2759953 RepID=A0A4Z0W7Q4_9GAMM|nr:thioredoxin family protein [Natronospirillum operosum]TGG94094.1 thioredoxin family protein [Natronospirillum operosum]
MARTPSTMVPLGTKMPDAKLPDPNRQQWRLPECCGERGLLVMFICNHCPFVIHIAPFLETLHDRLRALGIRVVAISANDIATHPEDSPDKMGEFAARYRLPFPYLYDESQQVAKSFDAACTPDFFLFDANLKLTYRGQLDDSRPGNDRPVTGEDLLRAAEQMARGEQPPPEQQKPSMGCNIKWKAGA